MARPKDPAADYTGGTPTAAYNRKPGDDYTSGTPTAAHDDGTRAVREEDYTAADVAAGRKQKYQDTVARSAEYRKYAALGQVTPQQAAARPSRFGSTWLINYNLQQAEKLDLEWNRVSEKVDPKKNPVIHDIVVEANKNGAMLSDQDIANLVSVGDHERALHAYSDFMDKRDMIGARNMIIDLQKTNPVLASMVPASFEKEAGRWVSEHGGKWVVDQARDPNMVQNALGWAGSMLTSESQWNPIHDFTLLWDGSMHALAASKVGDQEETVGGVFTNPLTYVPFLGPVMKGWAATEKDALDQKRLEEIRATKPAGVVDAALKIRHAYADGDPDVVVDMLMDENLDPQVANFIRDTLHPGKETATMVDKDGKVVPLGSRDLMEQILGARTDNIGDIITTDFLQAWNKDFNASNGYGSPLRSGISSGMNIAASFIDPTIMVTGAARIVIASRYAIAKLAPKISAGATEAERAAARSDIAYALRPVKIAGFETNRARRYMEGFLRGADKLDELEKGSVEYALAREHLARQYRLIPDDVAELFINFTSKTSVGRQVDGIIVDGERVSTGLVDVIADQNELWVALSKGISDKAADQGKNYLMNKAVALKLLDELDEDIVPLDKLKTMSTEQIEELYAAKLPEFKARAEAAAAKAAAAGEYSEKANELGAAAEKAADQYAQVRDAVGKSQTMEEAIVGRELTAPISERLTSRTQSRDPLMPRTGVIGDLRRRAVNGIFTSSLGAKRAEALVDIYLNGATTPEAVAHAVEQNYDKFGRAQRTLRGEGVLPGRAGVVGDRVTRLGSTMPNKLVLNIATAADADTFYKFARQFHSRPVAALLTDAFRRGGEGTRRDLIAATIRSGAAARGVNLSKEEIAAKLDELATGRMKGEAYAMETPGAPSAIMMESTRREAEKADKLVAKSEAVIAKRNATIEKAQAALEEAMAKGNVAGVEAAQKRIDNAMESIAKHEAKIAKQQIHFDRLENALLLSLGKKESRRPSKLVDEIPVVIQERPPVAFEVAADDLPVAGASNVSAPAISTIPEAVTGQPFRAVLKRGEGGADSSGGPIIGSGDGSIAGKGIYVTDDNDLVDKFRKNDQTGEMGSVRDVEIELRNPLVIRGSNEWINFSKDVLNDWPKPVPSVEYTEKLRKALLDGGHDGLIVDLASAGYDDAIRETWVGNTVFKIGDGVSETVSPLYSGADEAAETLPGKAISVSEDSKASTQEIPWTSERIGDDGIRYRELELDLGEVKVSSGEPGGKKKFNVVVTQGERSDYWKTGTYYEANLGSPAPKETLGRGRLYTIQWDENGRILKNSGHLAGPEDWANGEILRDALVKASKDQGLPIPALIKSDEYWASRKALSLRDEYGTAESIVESDLEMQRLTAELSAAVEAGNVTDAAILEEEIRKPLKAATEKWAAKSMENPKLRQEYLDSIGLGDTPSEEWVAKYKDEFDKLKPNDADSVEDIPSELWTKRWRTLEEEADTDPEFLYASDMGTVEEAQEAFANVQERFRKQILDNPTLWKRFAKTQGIDYDAPVSPEMAKQYEALYKETSNVSDGNGIRSSAGADVEVEEIAVARFGKKDKNDKPTETPQWKRWQKTGMISRQELADLFDAYGSEEVWSWWNTGMTGTDPAEVFDRYGPAPALLDEIGPNGRPRSTADRLPDEYMMRAESIGRQRGKFIKVPWKKTKGDLKEFIDSSYFDEISRSENAVINDVVAGLLDSEIDQFIAEIRVPMQQAAERNMYVIKSVNSTREKMVEEVAQGADTKPLERFVEKLDEQASKVPEMEQDAARAATDLSIQEKGAQVLDEVPTYDDLIADARRYKGNVHHAFSAKFRDNDGQFDLSVRKPRGLYDGVPHIQVSWNPNWHGVPWDDPEHVKVSAKWKGWQKKNNAMQASIRINMDGTLAYGSETIPPEIFSKMIGFVKEQFSTVQPASSRKSDKLFLAEIQDRAGVSFSKKSLRESSVVDGRRSGYMVFDEADELGFHDEHGVLAALRDAGYSSKQVDDLMRSLSDETELPDSLKGIAESWRNGETPAAVEASSLPEPNLAPVVDEPATVFDDATGEMVEPGYTMDDINTMVNDYTSTMNDPLKAANGTTRWAPSRDGAGRENGIHMYQMAKNVSIPSMTDIEAIGALRQMRTGRYATFLAQNSTDLWSLGTLYGFRFAQRSAIEDLISFALTAGLGRMPELYKGRRASTAVRDAAPMVKVVKKSELSRNKQFAKLKEKSFDQNARKTISLAEKRLPKLRDALANAKTAEEISKAEDAISQAESAIRTARAELDNDYVYIAPKNDPNLFFDRTSRLGMFNKWYRKMGDYAQARNLQFIQSVILPNIDVEKLAIAHAATTHGNYQPIRELIGETLGKQRFSKMSLDEIEYVKDLMGTPAGTAIFQDFAESAAKANSGSFSGMGHAADELLDIPDIEFAKPGKGVYYGPYKSLRLSAKSKDGGIEDGAMMAWYRRLQAIVDDDGPIGKIAIAHLNNPEKAKKAIADAIRKDMAKTKGKWGYAERWSLMDEGFAIDDFANRYYEAVLPYFLKRDNTLNWDLRNKFVHSYVNKKGEAKFKVSWTVSDDQGRNRFVLPYNEMSEIRPKDRPLYVLGREQSTIPMPKNEKAIWSDRAWDWMGNQYARIAREPIFMANYLANRKALKPMQDQLAQMIAGEGKKISRTDELVARRMVDRQAHDAAYSFSLSYMDNPSNRSILAYKVRNFARYYRATEDFYRRAGRLAKNYPDAYWKLALTYQVLDDTGWTYRDENGDLYFAYPGNQFLQDAISTISGPFLGGSAGIGSIVDPFQLGGKLKSIAPSTDPSQWLVTPSGPIGTIPLTLLFNKFPEFQGLRSVTLGQYSQAGQTGNLAGELLDTILPAGVQRFWNNLGPDERDASIAGAMTGALAISMANGTFDSVNPNEMTIEQLKNNDVYGEVSKSAWSTLITKMFFGYAAPASPQMYQNSVTDFGRELGISGMNQVWRKLIDKHEGDFAAAFADWQKIDPNGDLLPFTVSKTKDNPDLLASLTKAKPYKEVVEWTRTAEAKDLADQFPDSYLFLAPQVGEFTWDGWAMLKGLGLKVGKDTDAIAIDMFAAKGEREDAAIRAMYDAEIQNYDRNTESGRKEINRLEGEKSDARSDVEKKNPYWAAKRAEIRQPYMSDRIVKQFNQSVKMLDYLQSKNGELEGTAALMSVANSVWLDYNTEKAGFSSSTDAGQQSRRDITSRMEAELASIGAEDPAVASYIETILMNLDYGSL